MINENRPDYSNHPASAMRACYPYAPRSPRPPITASILTAFFNTDDVFLETATSILGQSFQEWEWIVVDDGSTDQGALDRLAEVERLDPRIRVIHQANCGPSGARNNAFKNSTGRYLCLLDSDDLIEPGFLEKTIWFLESQSSMAFCNSWSVTFGEHEYLHTTGFERGKAHVDANSGPFHSVIRREALAAVGGFDETIRFGHEDWDLWLALANAGFWGHTLPEYLEWYRRRGTGRHAQVVGEPETNKQFQQYIKKKYGSLKTRFPAPKLRARMPYEAVHGDAPFDNQLAVGTEGHRILVLIPWMVTGGADKVNLDWIRALVSRGYQVTICATLRARHDWLPEFAALTPDIFILPNFLHAADFPRFIVYLMRSRGIDTVLVSNSTLGYMLLPYLRASCPTVAFVDLSHVEEPHWLNGGHPRFGVGYQDMLDLNIVTTQNLRQWMGKMGADMERITACYTGVSLQNLAQYQTRKNALREALGIARKTPLLVYAGRICEQKRPDLLVSVLRSLAEQGVTFHCLVVGDGELLPSLKKQIKQHGLQQSVSLLGTLPHQRWLETLAASDIFFLPSLYEGISVALYEAMGMKVVPVMSAVGGQPELVTSECGILVPLGVGELEAYISALRLLIEDPQAMHEMAEAGHRRIAGQFTQEENASRFAEALSYARDLAVKQPRPALPIRLATELATSAIEYSRLTISDPLPARLTKFLAWARTYKAGRVLLRLRWVQASGRRLLQTLSWVRG